MDLMLFIVLLLSVVGNVVCCVVGVLLWKVVIPPSAMLMIRKRMGRLKDSMLALVCYDDGIGIVKALQVKHEGCLERDYKDGTSETYYIAKPSEDSDGDMDANRAKYALDNVVLPSVSVDGIPLALCYALDGAATNANVLLGLQLASVVSEKDPKVLDATIKVAVPEVKAATVEPTVEPVQSGKRGKKGKGRVGVVEQVKYSLESMRIKVLLPINPLDIHRTFKQYWDQSMLHATKKRNQNIGAAMAKNAGKDHAKLILIVSAIVSIAMIIAGVVVGFM
jgi:hypothetical protein